MLKDPVRECLSMHFLSFSSYYLSKINQSSWLHDVMIDFAVWITPWSRKIWIKNLCEIFSSPWNSTCILFYCHGSFHQIGRFKSGKKRSQISGKIALSIKKIWKSRFFYRIWFKYLHKIETIFEKGVQMDLFLKKVNRGKVFVKGKYQIKYRVCC